MTKISLKQKIIMVVASIFFSAVLLEAGLRIGGFVFLSMQEQRNKVSLRKKGTYRILCLGESTTAFGGKDSYPSQLEEILNQQNTGIRFSVINKGVPGAKTGFIVSRLEDNLNKYNPEMVIVMMGINDELFYKIDTLSYEDIFAKKVGRLLKSFRIYKLVKFLKRHIINKTQEIGIYKPRVDITAQTTGLKPSFVYNGREKSLKESIEKNPKNDQAYIELGQYYWGREEYNEAEEIFKKVIQINPDNDRAYVVLGYIYISQNKYKKAEEVFKKAIEINPEAVEGYLRYWYYARGRDDGIAEKLLREEREGDRKADRAYLALTFWYIFGEKQYGKAEEIFKKAIQINPDNDRAYAMLGYIYSIQNKYKEAGEALKKAIEINPKEDWAYINLAQCYKRQGEDKLADKYFKKVKRVRIEYYNPITLYNYRKLKRIVKAKGIKLVCVQYPLRSVKPLKRILGQQDSIIFVDNEKVFKEALKRASYEEYFTDMFGGDFGHCSAKGNRLLAKNIASVILREYFNK